MATTNQPPSYACQRTAIIPSLNGSPTGLVWDSVPWSDEFVDIQSPAGPPLPPNCSTRVKLLWDDANLYIGARLEEQHVWGTITQDNQVMFMDNDFEVFLDPDATSRNYYELEINALGAVWQLSLTAPYSQGGSATSPHELPGLIAKVHVDGNINDPSTLDTGWSVTICIPFIQLNQFGSNTPPKVGDTWRVNFSRVQWQHEIVDGKYVRVPPHGTSLPQGADQWHPERNIVWAPTGVVDIHRPWQWGFLTFVE